MQNDKDRQSSSSKPKQDPSSRPKLTSTGEYKKCSDASSKVSVHSAEANRKIADSRNNYAERTATESWRR